MSQIIELKTIQAIIESLDLIPMIEEGFVAYSDGQAVVPPVGELQLEKGEVHLKYGFIKSQPYYVIKIASGFYGNTELGLSTSNGCMLVFCQSTGQLKGVLLDEGHLTDVRTAVAGAVAAKYLAPKHVTQIGIVGTGIQAFHQLQFLRSVTNCRNVLVWGRSANSVNSFLERVGDSGLSSATGFQIKSTNDIGELQTQCTLIVTTTPACEPLLSVKNLQAGTHITAVGSDMPDKQELESAILARADLVVADSIEQCKTRGEISQALRSGELGIQEVIELGDVISGKTSGRTNDQQITIADLTGVAVQDIQVASAVFEATVNTG